MRFARSRQSLVPSLGNRVQAHLFDDLGWPAMIIRIMPDNHGSRRIADRLGARLTDEAAPDWYEGALTYRLGEAA